MMALTMLQIATMCLFGKTFRMFFLMPSLPVAILMFKNRMIVFISLGDVRRKSKLVRVNYCTSCEIFARKSTRGSELGLSEH